MAEPICEDEGLLQEWTPLTQLLQQIPLKTQRGLFFQNLSLTCLDVVPEFIVLGTNLGFAYWYCRATGDLQRLRFENCHCSVTCTKIMLFADYMVAIGTDQGTVIVFQIPKIEPGSTPDQIKLKQKQIERFTINGLHQAPVTCVEWDPNEMKVFSGDKIGCVVLTKINLNLHISKSMELLNEQFEIVQLSYSDSILLISTIYRSIICDGSNNWKVHQVGTKERKILGKFGATLCKFKHGLVIYASRPGHRLWLSDKNGVVQQTLIFKSAIQSSCQKIQLINPIDKKQLYDTSFGKVIQFGDNKLITYNAEILYVLHPGAVSVVSVLNSARKILDLAVNENEIFILEGERSLLRIGPLPDKYSLDFQQPESRRTSFNLDELAAKIKDTAVESIKKITKDLIATNDQTSPNSPPALADEALELPPIVSLPSIFPAENIEIHSSVSDKSFLFPTENLNESCQVEKSLQFVTADANKCPFTHDWNEEIVARPLRKRHNKQAKQNFQPLVSESESDTTSNISEDRLVCGVANDLSLSDEYAFSQSQSSYSVLRDISSLLGRHKAAGNEELMKTSDTKSQTSLDTCESVSERLLLTSEAFREEQERTFARLANQPLFDSFNSERTDNMSISLNMTTSSSFSSKMSENLPSPSYMSENSGAATRTKSPESQNTDDLENEMQSGSKGYWKWGNDRFAENSSLEENAKSSNESSVSNRNSQQERLYSMWSGEREEDCPVPGAVIRNSPDLPVESHTSEEDRQDVESGYHDSCFSETVLMNGVKNKVSNSVQECERENFSECCEPTNSGFLQSENFITEEDIEAENQEEGEEEAEEEEEEKKVQEETKMHEFEDKTFQTSLSNEALSYGPPSGSSTLGIHPSSDFSILIAPQISQPLVQDSFDHWPQYKTPGKITSLSACKDYVVCSTDVKKRLYYSQLPGLGLSWKLLSHKASMVRVASDGSKIWLLDSNSVSAFTGPISQSPKSTEDSIIARDIQTFAIDTLNNDALMITLSGQIVSYCALKNTHKKQIDCDHIVAGIACSGGVILAVSNDFTVLCKLPEEEQFKEVKTLKPVTSIALGPENLLWVVDEDNNIFFSDDYMRDEPHWWQIQISDYVFQKENNIFGRPFQLERDFMKLKKLTAQKKVKRTLVATNENSVWVYNKFDSCVWVNKTGFTGYIWNAVPLYKIPSNIEWQTLSDGGAYQDKGRLWLLSVDGNIFCLTYNHQGLQSLPVSCDENILCITSSVDTLWVLSESGRIYSRLGLSNTNVSGTSWKEMKSPQIDNLRFVWISCGRDVAWACDIHGRTFITIGLPHQMATLDPSWIEVEGRPKDVQFEKVFVGSEPYMVWAIDTNHNLYVREGIFPHYQIGTSWVYVCGIEANHITFSGAYVWALACNGDVYRRCGVSKSNFIGDYWRSIPGNLKEISCSFTGELWGIDHENKILRLSYNLKILRDDKVIAERKETGSSKDDNSWEIVK